VDALIHAEPPDRSDIDLFHGLNVTLLRAVSTG
jgi:hypothetical protein